jgi:hypothetical protein
MNPVLRHSKDDFGAFADWRAKKSATRRWPMIPCLLWDAWRAAWRNYFAGLIVT